MKFLVDESIEYPFFTFLKNKKFDVKSVIDIKTGMTDKEVLKLAFDEKRILITNDKDFGQLIIHYRIPTKGIIIFSLPEETTRSKIKIFSNVFKKIKNKIYNNLVIIKRKSIRFVKI